MCVFYLCYRCFQYWQFAPNSIPLISFSIVYQAQLNSLTRVIDEFYRLRGLWTISYSGRFLDFTTFGWVLFVNNQILISVNCVLRETIRCNIIVYFIYIYLCVQEMMKDQYGNYVVQKVLETCSDQQREMIMTRIKIHLTALKKYTYGKHIVARVEKLVAAGGTLLLPSLSVLFANFTFLLLYLQMIFLHVEVIW